MSTTARTKAPDTRGPVRKLLTSFGFQILAALVLGIAAGLIARQLGATATEPNGLSATLARTPSPGNGPLARRRASAPVHPWRVQLSDRSDGRID